MALRGEVVFHVLLGQSQRSDGGRVRMFEAQVLVGRDESRDQFQSLLAIRRDFVRWRREWSAVNARDLGKVKLLAAFPLARMRSLRFGLSGAVNNAALAEW